jgi:nitrate reductase gamma subunit
VKKLGSVSVPILGFFAGMATILAALVILTLEDHPETWILSGITVVATIAGTVAMVIARRPEPSAAAPT